jgi:hypothetical protein
VTVQLVQGLRERAEMRPDSLTTSDCNSRTISSYKSSTRL